MHNQGAQFWFHYFRRGVGLVNLSFFSQLAGAEGSQLDRTRNLTRSNEYQWFTHDLGPEIFAGAVSERLAIKLGDYFASRVNPTLVSPYSIRFENPLVKEPYKFVSGSLERLKEVLTRTRFVCQGLKRAREPNGRNWVSPHMRINCGNLKDAPTFERVTETFVNAVGALAVKKTLLTRFCGARAAGGAPAWKAIIGRGRIDIGYFLIWTRRKGKLLFG